MGFGAEYFISHVIRGSIIDLVFFHEVLCIVPTGYMSTG
jgi:hypothetical protein